MTESHETGRALKSLGKFSLSTLAASTVEVPLRMARSVVFARVLGPAGMGVYRLFQTVPALAVSVGTLGFGLGSVYLVAKKKCELRTILGNTLLYALVQGALLGGIVFLLFALGVVPRESAAGLEGILLPVCIAVPLLLFQAFAWDLLMGTKAIHLRNVLGILYAASPVLLLLALWKLSGNAVMSAVWAWIVATVLVSVFAFLRVYRRAEGAPRVSLQYMKEALSFGLRGNLSMFAGIMVRRMDVLFIAHYLGIEYVGYYAISVSIAEMLLVLPDTVSGPFLPLRLEMTEEAGRRLSVLVVKYVLPVMLVACAITALLGKPIIFVLYGSRFLPAVAPLQWLLPGILFASIWHFLKADIYSLNRPGFVSWASFITMLSNFVLNYLLIPRFGMNGAAVSSSIAHMISTGMLLWFFLRRTGCGPAEMLLLRKKDLVFAVDQLRVFWNKKTRGEHE